jgi:tripartite-type tricarboxylate transporter receptor subunit TctC
VQVPRIHRVTARSAACCVLACACTALFAAEIYPNRPIRIVVPNTAGSGLDAVSRLIGSRFTAAWGQQVVIDNRAGAGGNIGTEIVARASPDGYTLLMMTSLNPILYAMYEKQSYDLIKSFAPVSLLASTPFIVAVNPSVAAGSMRELIALAKSRPGQLNYGTPGSGSSSHLATELLKSMAGIDLVHVPYKGTTPVVIDTMSGQLQLTTLVAPAVLPSIRAGRLRALGVTSARRTPLAPDIPALAESVAGYEWSGWYGLVAPAGTPREIINRLNREQTQALRTAEFAGQLSNMGADAIGTTPEEFALHIRTQLEKMRVAIRVSGARPD